MQGCRDGSLGRPCWALPRGARAWGWDRVRGESGAGCMTAMGEASDNK